MKAIIPVAGAGTKLRPHSYTQPKALIPLAGKTVLSIIVDQLKEAGIHEFIFIVGYLGEKIEDYVNARYPELKVHYVHQTDRQGVGHAVELTKELVGGDEVFVVLGDTICEYDVKEVINNPESMIGVRKVDDPREFGVAEINEDGLIEHVVEKPQIPKSNMAMVGIYKIRESNQLFDCLESNISQGLRSYGEYNLTDALDCMIKSGVKFRPFRVENWFDCGRKETLLESNALLLKKFATPTDAGQFENTVIVPPVSIGAGCTIKNSIIGPNSNLFDIVLADSVIGSDTNLRGESRSLNIGDNTSIDLG